MAIVKISDLPLVDSPVEGTDLFVVVQDNVTKKAYASDIQTYVGFEEIQYATAGQTVFNLTTMSYAPGGNNLMVFVDGVNQYEGLSYTETNSTRVTFSQGLHVGAVVKFSTVQTQTSLVNSAGAVTFTAAGTGAVATNVQAKLRQTVSVKDFGAVGDGVTDDAAAFAAAIAAAKNVYVPAGTYEIGSNISITTPVRIYGDGPAATIIERNYSPTSNAQGVFAFSGGGTIGSINAMTIRSKTGQTGGCLVSIVSGPSDTLGLYRFDWVNFTTTGTSTHQYTVYTDGTAKTSAPIGIRGLDFTACQIFGGAISSLLVQGVLKFSFVGGGCYPAGGAAGSNVSFTGTASVPTQSFVFLPSDCSCPIAFDYAILGVFGCGIMGAVTNTANTQNIYGFGRVSALQQNWLTSMFMDTQSGIALVPSSKISNKGASPDYPLEMLGAITGFLKTGSVASVGQTGVAYQTVCPDTQTFSFTNGSGKLFTIAASAGAAALVFADFKSATVSLLSNPSNEFEASSTPTAGKTGIFKSSNSQTISVKNGTGSSATYSILNVGIVTSTTDPA